MKMRNKRPTLIDVFNFFIPPCGIATSAMAIGIHLKSGDGWRVAIYSVLCLFCMCVTMTRILDKDESDE